MGYGGCMLGNVERTRLAEHLGIDTAKYSIDLVLALGKPKEKVVVVPVGADGECSLLPGRGAGALCTETKSGRDDSMILYYENSTPECSSGMLFFLRRASISLCMLQLL